ncbi:hypothetical protein HDU99_005442, partial [Rhizoclosmatium hyalinum]
MEEKVDANNRNSFYLWTANRWLNLRCEYLSAVMSSVVGFAIIAAGLDPGWAGLTMIYVFEFTSNLTWLIRSHATLDMSMNAVERVDEYSAIDQEPPAIIPNNRPPPLWPSRGEIHVRNLSLKYAPELPNVLHELTFSTYPSEKIGVVGRTGAGKSTLTLAFFRILNQFEGSIVIDNIDITSIGLRDLRNRLTIIPQDPVLFEGTLRFNLDPLGAYTDEVIWDAVKAVGLLESMQTASSTGLKRNESGASLSSTVTAVGAAGSSGSQLKKEVKSGKDAKSESVAVKPSSSAGSSEQTVLSVEDSTSAAKSRFSLPDFMNKIVLPPFNAMLHSEYNLGRIGNLTKIRFGSTPSKRLRFLIAGFILLFIVALSQRRASIEADQTDFINDSSDALSNNALDQLD